MSQLNLSTTATDVAAGGVSRRHALRATAATALVLGLPTLQGCSTTMPLGEAAPTTEACEAHGLAALRSLSDFSIAYDGEWRLLIDRIQPLIVDKGYRKTSDERWLLREGVVAQRHYGPQGTKHVVRELPRTVWGGKVDGVGTTRVWYDGAQTQDAGVVAASTLVADAYGLFLLGPMWLAGRDLPMRRPGINVEVNGRDCEVLEAWLRPGIGFSNLDRLTLAIDRRDRTMRRVTFTLESMDSTRGAVVETDTFDHMRRHGVLWPTRFYERLRRPFPNFPAHDWWVTGLDVSRGFNASQLRGPNYTGPAESPARLLTKG
jgi:hypothetical protein